MGLELLKLNHANLNFMSNIASIEDLICGIHIEKALFIDSDYVGLVTRLRADIAELHPQIQKAIEPDAILPASSIFPFLARKFLELSLTSILARLDPLRVIAARKHQLDDSYKEGQKNPSSISWTGDIFPQNPDTNNVWNTTTLAKGVQRSLFGGHYSEIAILPGLQYLIDNNNYEDSAWLREFAKSENPFKWLTEQLRNLYSILSKGVHFEYLLDDRVDFDTTSIKQHMQDCYMLVLVLATATHVSPLFLRSIRIEDALLSFKSIEKKITS